MTHLIGSALISIRTFQLANSIGKCSGSPVAAPNQWILLDSAWNHHQLTIFQLPRFRFWPRKQFWIIKEWLRVKVTLTSEAQPPFSPPLIIFFWIRLNCSGNFPPMSFLKVLLEGQPGVFAFEKCHLVSLNPLFPLHQGICFSACDERGSKARNSSCCQLRAWLPWCLPVPYTQRSSFKAFVVTAISLDCITRTSFWRKSPATWK